MLRKFASKYLRSAMLAAGGLSAAALASPAMADVTVAFEGYLSEKMDRITSIDKNREEVFRQFRTEGTRNQVRPRDSLNRGYFAGTEWGNERIFPELEAYNVPGLIEGMIERGIRQADPDFSGTVVVTVDKLRVKDFSLAVVSAGTTQMGGTVKVLDAAGNVTAEHDVWTGLAPDYTASNNYDGPDYAYTEEALHTRIGPIAAEFAEKTVETLYPGFDAPGAVVLHSRDR